MTSQEKLLRMKDWLLEQRPEDDAAGALLRIIVGILPGIVTLLPEDPAELDNYLRTLAWAVLNCRSDDAYPPTRAFDYVHSEDGTEGWVEVRDAA